MKKLMVIASCALMLMASPAAAQSGSSSSSTSSSSQKESASQKQTATTNTNLTTTNNDFYAKFVKTLTNVQIELTLTDQLGSLPPEKKTVSMIASSGNWGKVRSGADVFPAGEPPYHVVLNVDARPFVSLDGPIQLEMTLVYEPAKGDGDTTNRRRPSGINQSQTIILQSGKPLVVSQAADPVTDRKVIVEVKATVLK